MLNANLREIVNGRMLPQFTGKKISIIGFAQNVNPNGLTFDLRTTDEEVIKVNFRRPPRDPVGGHVEVHGTAQGTTVICDGIVQFSSTESSDFDAASYNTLCTLLQTVPNLSDTGN